MELLRDKVITKVSEKLPTLSASDILEYVERAEEYFLTVTKRTAVPEKAFWLWVDIAVTMQKEGVTASGGNVLSVKRGDTTISYAENAASLSNITSMINRVNSYRVVVSR